MRPKRRFLDYLKNPALFWTEVSEADHADAAPAPRGKRLAALVTAIGKRRPEYGELQRLRKAGPEIVPLLVAALRDPDCLFRLYGENQHDGSFLETATDLLEPFAEPPAAVLEPALRHEDDYFRAKALYHLARCGNDDAIPFLLAGLASPSEECRSYTLIGLEFLKHPGRGTGCFRRTLFDAALPLLNDTDRPAEYAPRALLALERERAEDVLLGEGVMRADNRRVYETLRALKDANVPVPAAQMRALLVALRGKAGEFPFDFAYENAMILIARAEGPAAADVIADAQVWGNEWVKRGAAEAAAISTGVQDAYSVVMERYERAGVAGLSDPQRNYLALNWLDAEVCNGGFSQFFFNSTGELAGYAVTAAKAVGATDAAEVIRSAVALFGPSGPAADRAERLEQLSELDLDALRELNSKYYALPADIHVLLQQYVARNPREFTRPAG